MDNPPVVEPAAPKREEVPIQPGPPTFIGNSNDLIAVIAASTAAMSGLCCLTWGYGIYCLPLIGLILGAVAVLNAKASHNPGRTRQWGWISVGVNGGVLLVIFLLVLCFVLFYAALIAGMLAGAPLFPTPTRTLR